MKGLIVEDEGIAAERLIGLVMELEPSVEIVGQMDSIKSTVRWFLENPAPDLAFFDIQLADGHSFEIFEKADVFCPIIFTTAYDQYAIQAFKVNSVDYLLKPIKKEDLGVAMKKFSALRERTLPDMKELIQLMKQQNMKYKERFVIKIGEHLKSVNTIDAAAFYSQDKATYLQTIAGQKYLLDHTLDQLEGLVDPKQFFRISRKYIVNASAISDMLSYTNSRLKLRITNFSDDEVIVARERVGEFKEWLDR